MTALGIILILISLPLMMIPIIGVPLFIIGVVVILNGIGNKNSDRTAAAIAKALKDKES